jgi:hypothetical protein
MNNLVARMEHKNVGYAYKTGAMHAEYSCNKGTQKTGYAYKKGEKHVGYSC